MGIFQPDAQKPTTRRRFLKSSLLAAGALAVYSGEIERHWVEETRIDIGLAGLPAAFEGLRIVQLSDIHMDEFTEPLYLRHVVDKVNRMAPEIVLMTGDFVSEAPRSKHFAIGAAWQCAEILDRLECRQRYAVMGNHDVIIGAKPVTEALSSRGIQVLHNTFLPLERDMRGNRGRIWLAGLADPLVGHPEPDRAIPELIRGVANEPVLLMCHGPDYVDHLAADPVGKSIGLVLSGHTHGGQVRLPGLPPAQLPPMGQKYVEGWFRFGAMQLYVNRGIGTVGVPFRLFCPPEITQITLRKA